MFFFFFFHLSRDVKSLWEGGGGEPFWETYTGKLSGRQDFIRTHLRVFYEYLRPNALSKGSCYWLNELTRLPPSGGIVCDIYKTGHCF